jgi:hypothetical protein
MKKNYNSIDILGLMLGFFGGGFVSFACLGLALTAEDSLVFILPVMVLVLVCSAVPGAIAKKNPVLLWFFFITGYAPLQVLLGAGLIFEGSSVGVWVVTHLAVLLLAALGIWIGSIGAPIFARIIGSVVIRKRGGPRHEP